MALRRLSRKLGSLLALVKLVNLPSQFATAESNKKPHFGKFTKEGKDFMTIMPPKECAKYAPDMS
ncbi:hypothetical protein BRE01_58030 [Brevibacillus reuszeri]|uniref:Uncharacterized protein n=1 Tax=Brevibacillus reuszeri TaxID=54915 RepID=A0ABQ0TW94_9BACL|nr:hypothetical protein BRE01_58030 [Brevibacillus reuszeri]